MSDSRGAASVTLDTIIAAALRELAVKERGPGNVGSYEDAARAVTDALLAKGWLGWTDPEDDHSPREIHTADLDPWARSPVVVIPLEAS